MGNSESSTSGTSMQHASDMIFGKPKAEPRTTKKVAGQKIENAAKTGVLSLTGHGLTAKELPAAVWGVKRLTTLDLTNNKLESLAPEVGQLTDLKTLKLDHNRLATLPSELSGLMKLSSISAGDNNLSSTALTLPSQGKLTKLSLPRNALGTAGFSACCGVLTLQELNLSKNGLSAVPEALSRLKQLVELILDDNSITVLPEASCNGLVKLKALSLKNNQITGPANEGAESLSDEDKKNLPLPACLFMDTPLERLNLEGNPIDRRQLMALPGADAWLERCAKTKQKDVALYMS